MGITRPTGEQLRFRSATTGDHILDTYMENSEKGSRTLPDLMDDLFDGSGVFRSANFEFRFDETTDKIQFRAGNFANSNTGWTDITTFFNITGAFNASTTYNNFDLLTLTNKDVYIVHGLSSGTTFADEAAVIASANTDKLVDVSEARDWASKTDGQVVSTDYSSKAYAVGGTGIDTTTGSAKDWAIKTSSTVGNTGEYSAKYWATSTAVTTVSSGIANINTVAAAIANVNTTATNISNVNTVAGISADVTSVANIDGNVSTVAGISANTTTVAGIAANVTTVAGIHANVTTVAGIASNVTTVANNNTDVSTVATNITDLQTVADEIDNNNLQTVANDINAVVTAANDLNEATSEIETVANSITNVDLVGGSISNVNTVATNIANVNTTATNIANVNTVGGISANVTTVAGISSDVTTAATNNANITTVAGISSNVTTVAGISANVTTVANISADVTTAASNVTAFNNTYLGAQSSAPTQDPDGSALDVGDLYFDTTSNTMKVYASGGWTSAGSSVNGTANRYSYTATAGQTVFAATYDAGYVDVFLNGVKQLVGTDVTATSGTSVVFASGTTVNDIVEIIAYGTFVLADHLTQTQSDARYVQVAGDTMTGNLSMGDNVKAVFGAGSDLQIYHDGNSKIADVGGGKLELHSDGTGVTIQKGATEYMAQFLTDGAVQLYHDNAQKFATTSTGIDVTGNATFADNGKAIFGAGSDLEIYHDTANSNIRDVGTGFLGLDTNGSDVRLTSGSNAKIMGYFEKDGPVYLYYDGNGKLATTNTGIDVTGAITADALNVSAASPNIDVTDTGTSHASQDFLTNSNAVRATIGVESSAGGGLFVGSSAYAAVFGTASAGATEFATNNNVRMTISSSGSVGINNSSPVEKLHIKGTNPRIYVEGDSNSYYPSIRVDGVNGGISLGTYYGGNISAQNSLTFLTGDSATDGGSPRLQIRSDNDIEIRNLQSAAGGVDTNALYWKIQNSANTGQYSRLGGIKAETVSNWGGKLKFYTKPANGTPNDTVTEQMVIDQAGRVTMPYQPVAAFGSTVNNANTQRFGASNVYVNIGGHLDTGSNSGRFTCPVAGNYLCTFSGYTNHSSGYGYVSLRKNGLNQGDAVHWNNGNQSHSGVTLNTVLNCAAGNYLEYHLFNANSYVQGARITFQLIS